MRCSIVTVTDNARSFNYDIQVPSDIAAFALADNILAALKSYDTGILLNVRHARIFYPAEKRHLSGDESLASAGIWDGGVIIIV